MPTTKNARLPLMDPPALAERLGVNHRYVRRLVAEKRVPFIKYRHLLRFDQRRSKCGSYGSGADRHSA